MFIEEMKKKPIKYINAVNDVLQRIQNGLRTQDLTSSEVELLVDRFGHNWFEDLGYHQLKPHKHPIYNN